MRNKYLPPTHASTWVSVLLLSCTCLLSSYLWEIIQIKRNDAVLRCLWWSEARVNTQSCCRVLSISFISARHPQLQDYSTVIKTPMWLGEVADKLQEQLYQTVGEFVSDVQLIFTNCAVYNRVSNKKEPHTVSLQKVWTIPLKKGGFHQQLSTCFKYVF